MNVTAGRRVASISVVLNRYGYFNWRVVSTPPWPAGSAMEFLFPAAGSSPEVVWPAAVDGAEAVWEVAPAAFDEVLIPQREVRLRYIGADGKPQVLARGFTYDD